jgi:hypothetical protein
MRSFSRLEMWWGQHVVTHRRSMEALTFGARADPEYTPRLLDSLKKYQAMQPF